MRWASVGAAARKARAISSVVRPHTSRSVSATCASGGRAGWQQVKISRSRSSSTLVVRRRVGRRPSASSRSASSAERGVEPRAAAQRVDGLEAAGRDQPGPRIGRHAVARPLLDGRARRPRAAPPRRGRSRRAGGSAWRGRGATRRGRRRPPCRGRLRPGFRSFCLPVRSMVLRTLTSRADSRRIDTAAGGPRAPACA